MNSNTTSLKTSPMRADQKRMRLSRIPAALQVTRWCSMFVRGFFFNGTSVTRGQTPDVSSHKTSSGCRGSYRFGLVVQWMVSLLEVFE